MEARLEAHEQRLSMITQPPRPEPDPPYGMPYSWQSTPWLPGVAPPTAVTVTVPPPLPSSAVLYSMVHPPQYQQHQPQQPLHLWMTQYQVPPPQQPPAAGYYYQQQQGQTAAAYGDTTLPLSEQPQLDLVPEVNIDEVLASNNTSKLENQNSRGESLQKVVSFDGSLMSDFNQIQAVKIPPNTYSLENHHQVDMNVAASGMDSRSGSETNKSSSITGAVQQRHPQDAIEKHLVDLEMKLQMASEEITASLEEQSSGTLLRVPRASHDVFRLHDEALSLRSSVANILISLKKAEGSSAESIDALAKIDIVKRRMEAAYEALQDAAGLTQLSSNW